MKENKGRKLPSRPLNKPSRYREDESASKSKSDKKKVANPKQKKAFEGKKKPKGGVHGKVKPKAAGTKIKKKEKRVPKSDVLVKKNRGKSDKTLDDEWRTKLAQQSARNVIYSEQSVRTDGVPLEQSSGFLKPRCIMQNTPGPNQQEVEWRSDFIAPDLVTAVQLRVDRFWDRDEVKLVPAEFRRARQSAAVMSKNQMKRDKTGFNFLASSFHPAVNNVIVAPAAQQQIPNAAQGGAPQPPPPPGGNYYQNSPVDTPPPGETLTFAALVAKIPAYIKARLDKASKLMYLLRMIFSRDEIARCSLTGKKSPYPSFEVEFGPHRIGLFYRVATEEFGIDKKEIATLICKRINYIRNSPRILKVAQEKRIAISQKSGNTPPVSYTQQLSPPLPVLSTGVVQMPGGNSNEEHDEERDYANEEKEDEEEENDEESEEEDEEEDSEEEDDQSDYEDEDGGSDVDKSGDDFDGMSNGSVTEKEDSDDDNDDELVDRRFPRKGRY